MPKTEQVLFATRNAKKNLKNKRRRAPLPPQRRSPSFQNHNSGLPSLLLLVSAALYCFLSPRLKRIRIPLTPSSSFLSQLSRQGDRSAPTGFGATNAQLKREATAHRDPENSLQVRSFFSEGVLLRVVFFSSALISSHLTPKNSKPPLLRPSNRCCRPLPRTNKSRPGLSYSKRRSFCFYSGASISPRRRP